MSILAKSQHALSDLKNRLRTRRGRIGVAEHAGKWVAGEAVKARFGVWADLASFSAKALSRAAHGDFSGARKAFRSLRGDLADDAAGSAVGIALPAAAEALGIAIPGGLAAEAAIFAISWGAGKIAKLAEANAEKSIRSRVRLSH